jgi:hypothetical protein
VVSALVNAVYKGQLKVPVQRQCTLEEVPIALQDFEQEGTLGKLVIITR